MSDTYISIKQYDGMNVTAQDDRRMYDMVQGNGIIRGCECTFVSGNTVHVNAGCGVIKGAYFEIEEHNETITLVASGTAKAQIYIHFDLSSATPLTIETETAATLTELEQDDDANYTNGTYDIQLCTMDVGTTAVSDVTNTFPIVTNALENMIGLVNKTTIFQPDGSIKDVYGDGHYTITDFPAGYICRVRLYGTDGTLLRTKTTSATASGNIVDTIS